MKQLKWFVFMVVLVSFLSTIVWAEDSPEMRYYPTCDDPQDIAPMQPAGSTYVSTISDVVWNGKDYAVMWVSYDFNISNYYLYFRRFFADGTPVTSAAIQIGLGVNGEPPSLVWNGNGYGVAWIHEDSSYYQVFFARLDENGSIIGSEVRVSFVGASMSANTSAPSLAWGGSGYAVTWEDYRNGDSDIYATLLNADGTIGNAGSSHDLEFCTASNDQYYPAIAWSQGEDEYIGVWQDYRSGSKYEIWGAMLFTSGGSFSYGTALVSGSSDSYVPALCDAGNGMGLTWYDSRDGNSEIYFARLTSSGNKIGSDLRLTTDTNMSSWPYVAWTGVEYGVFWSDNRSGNYDIWFQRVTASGTPQGSNMQTTFSGETMYPAAAFAQYGYLVTGTITNGANYVQPFGCNYPYVPPCPENLVAYSITGSSATISWLPVIDNYTDIAYYEVYRDNTLVGITDETYLADSGLSTNVTYNYAIRTVNAGQYVSTGCGSGSSLYVKTDASMRLMVDKSSPDAHLNWTDATMNNYNVFRGTNPQVMSKIGNTADQSFDDPNVLLDSNIYFYTVDAPGF